MKRCNYCFDVYDENLTVCPHCEYAEGSEAAQPYHLCPGTVLNDRYVIGQVLGFGGFGITYKAWDKTLESVMAIKEYYPGGLVNRVPNTEKVILFSGKRRKEFNHGLMRFLDEARSMARFSSHKYIINVFEYFEANDTAYIVMEFLDGITLAGFLKASKNKMRPETCMDVIEFICEALKDVHKIGIVHRDVSPDNIFLCTNNRIKLIDFGAARFGNSEDTDKQLTIMLKPGFAPPEQYERVNVQGPWTDIYALGATFYYMVTGLKPEESTNRRVNDTLLPPHEVDSEVPEYLSTIIMQAMALDRHMRFASIAELEKAIKSQRVVLSIPKQIKRRKRRRMTSLIAAFLVVAVWAFVLFLQIEQQREEETLAETTISFAFAQTGHDFYDAQRQAAFYAITNEFLAGFPLVTIYTRMYSQAEFEAAILADPPTLFESSTLSPEALEEHTANLNRFANQQAGIHFLNDFSTHFPYANQIPLGFNAPVLYINRLISDIDASGMNDHEFLQALRMEQNREEFLNGETAAYFADSRLFTEVQRRLAGRYRLLYIDTDSPEASFSELWSISRYAAGSELLAAERFLNFMLRDSAQDILHIRNRSGALPINQNVLRVFSEVHHDFDSFFENIDSYVFP